MKYLVSAANNTWRLPDAIQAAADTIEFQVGYSPVVDMIILNKSLHFKGKVTTGEGGNRNFTNVITGKFNIR
jgi:lipid-binding SYLF domain-containing protein